MKKNYLLMPVYRNPKLFRDLTHTILQNDISRISGIIVSIDSLKDAEFNSEAVEDQKNLINEVTSFRDRVSEKFPGILFLVYGPIRDNKGVDGNAHFLWRTAFDRYKADNALLIEQDSLLSRDTIGGVFKFWTKLSYDDQGLALCLFCQSKTADYGFYVGKERILHRCPWFSSHCVAFSRKRWLNTVSPIWKKTHGAWDETMQLYCDIDGLHTVVPMLSRVLVPWNNNSEKTTIAVWKEYYEEVRSCGTEFTDMENYRLDDGYKPLYGKGSDIRFFKGIKKRFKQTHFMELLKK